VVGPEVRRRVAFLQVFKFVWVERNDTCVRERHSSWLDGFSIIVVLANAGAVLERDVLLVKIWCGVCVHFHSQREKNYLYNKEPNLD
jgi:hypothetical protein